MPTPNFDARLNLTRPELRRQAAEDKLTAHLEAAFELSANELAKRFGDEFINFLNALVEAEFNEREDC